MLIVALSSFGCRTPDLPRADVTTPSLRDPSIAGRFTDLTLVEASGLVRSSIESNVFWSHNDSGGDARLYSFDSTGRALGTTRVPGATNRDWEALASGPCTGGSCLYIGDVGDNTESRDNVTMWRVGVPNASDTRTTTPERLTLRYADGPRDVEAIWVAPDTNVYLLTKRPDRGRLARIYRVSAAAWRSDAIATAVIVDSLHIVPRRDDTLGWITDAALSGPDNTGERRLAVRSYRDVFVYAIDAITWRPTSLVGKCELSALREKSGGEGVTWLADGRLMFDAEGEAARLHTGWCP